MRLQNLMDLVESGLQLVIDHYRTGLSTNKYRLRHSGGCTVYSCVNVQVCLYNESGIQQFFLI